jgi:Na+-driven multidrug efflux pump
LNENAHMTPRERILNDRPFSALWRLALPNMIASFTQSLMLVAEGWYIGGLGGQALAGIALVFPLLMLTLMLASGAMGGAVGGAMARAVGADDMPQANAVLRLAILFALVIGGLNGLLLILFGRQIFIAMGGDGAILQFAEEYSAVLFPGIVLLWLTNMAAAAMRGTGHMIQPAIGLALVVVVHFALVAGQRAMGYPLGVVGGAWALIGAFSAGLVYFVVVLARPGRAIRLTLRGWTGMIGGRRILGVGLLAGSQSFLTIIYTMLATAVFARMGADWLAGYGIGARLEMFVVPFVFGIGGASMVATGTLLGAGRRADAIRMGWMAAYWAAAILGVVGTVLAIWPGLWTGMFTDDPAIQAAAAAYLLRIGPLYAFFALGLCLYLASQGMETLTVPVIGAILRLLVVAAGFGVLSLADALTPENALIVIAISMAIYGGSVALGLRAGHGLSSGTSR